VRLQNYVTSLGSSITTQAKKEYLRQQATALEKMPGDFSSSIDMQKQYLTV
jgi:hypothetical protein